MKTSIYVLLVTLATTQGFLSRNYRETNLAETDQQEESGFLNTLNLSMMGNTHATQAFNKMADMARAIMDALGSLLDFKFVGNMVDATVERLIGNSREGRSEGERQKHADLKAGITTIVGAVLGEQECWKRTACRAGEFAKDLPGKDFMFIVLERLAPDSWLNTLDISKVSATYEDDCNRFECTDDPEGIEYDA